MSGFGNADGVTPGRATVVRFNKFGSTIICPYMSVGRTAEEMVSARRDLQENVEYVPGIGIRLKQLLFDSKLVWEKEIPRRLESSNSTLASSLFSFHLHQEGSDTGLTYTDTDAQSGLVHQKQIAAGDSWDNELAADVTSYPGPPSTGATSPLDRVLVSNDVHEPNDTLSFWVWVPGVKGAQLGAIAQFYFTGPAGRNKAGVGIGNYCLRIHAGGLAILFELRSGGSWVERKRFDISPKSETGSGFTIAIVQNTALNSIGQWIGSKISFVVAQADHSDKGFQMIEHLITLSMIAISKHVVEYKVPRKGKADVTPCQIRVDMRRDARCMFWAARGSHVSPGKVVDTGFTLPAIPVGAAPLRLEWYGDVPAGTTVTATLIDDATGSALTPTIVTDDIRGQVIHFAVPAPVFTSGATFRDSTRYHVEFDLTGGDKTPTITHWVLKRDPVYETPSVSEIVTPYANPGSPKLPVLFVDKESGVSITSQTQDQSSDHASLTVADMTGQQISLRWRTGTPINVEVWDTATDTLVTTLFRGIIGKTNADLFGRQGHSYPSPDASMIAFDVAGEYARLNRRLVASRIFLYDYSTVLTDGGLPMKVTRAIEILLQEAGYAPSQMQIPDLPIRLFGDVNGTDLTIEPKTRIADTIFQMLEDYLGATIIWCPNSGTSGMWRLIRKPVPPYNRLMRFYRQHPGAKKLPSTLRSYLITMGTSPYGSQIVSPNYMIRGTAQLSYEPPEGNCVTVVGGGSDENGNQEQFTRTVYNLTSYNALGLSDADPHYPVTDGPDFLGEHVEIWVGDASLNSQEAVDFVARRMYEIACFGREYLSFEAPLRFILDLNDPYQTEYRPLRFGDVVDVEQPDGSFRNYAVVRVSPRYTHDNNQTAFYELATCTNFDTVGMVPSSFDLHSLTRARIRQARRQAGEPERIRPLRGKNRQIRYREMVMWAGAAVPKQLQYMDTTQPNFGQFVPMSGFDPGAI